MTTSTGHPPVPRTHADFAIASRRATRRLLLRTAAALALLGAAALLGWFAFITFSRTAGPVTTGPWTTTIGFSMAPGQTGAWGDTVLYNDSDTDAVLQDIRPVDPPPGLEIVDVLVGGPDRRYASVGSSSSWPDTRVTDLRPVKGATIAPVTSPTGERGIQAVVVFRAARPGRYVLDGLQVDYRVGRRDHRRVIDAGLQVCFRTRITEQNRYCDR